MDFSTKINSIISSINNFNFSREKYSDLIVKVCDLFDDAINQELSSTQLSLLYFFSNTIGVPQYFDLLCKRNDIHNNIDFSNNLFLTSLVRESSLFIDFETKVHIFQKEIIEKFEFSRKNRFIMSAPTSFGKTFIIYSIIKRMRYQNVVLLFPTISLLSENLQRLIDLESKKILSNYKIITLSEEIPEGENNIFVFTPERFMTFVDKNPRYHYDFVFMDEIYKIDNEFLSNDEDFELQENSRDISFRIALETAISKANDCLLSGPFLNYVSDETMANFIRDNEFTSLIYNDIELVKKNQISYRNLKKETFDNIKFNDVKLSLNGTDKIASILREITNEQTIIYCPRKYLAEDYALKLVAKDMFCIQKDDRFVKFLDHLGRNYTKHWCLVKTLNAGIGIHHGTIPKYIQREIIRLFNQGQIKCLFSTTTITEGVNTTAKNMIILSHKKGIKKLKKFDILNIIGRAGRFGQHFSGRVFVLDEELNVILESDDDILSHKNYGIETTKSELDLAITKEKYLSSKQSDKKNEILQNYDRYEVPQNIRDTFLTIVPEEKVAVYRLILLVMNKRPDFLPNIIEDLYKRRITLDGLQLLVEVIRKVIPEDDKLYGYTEKGEHDYSIITYMLHSYIIGGFPNLLIYELKRGSKIDSAVRKVTNIVYNIFRYELVKHIGLIDLVYRTIYAQRHETDIDGVKGFSPLLSYLEYGAYTEKGRKASDYGISFNLLKHIENHSIDLDDYEIILNEELEKILS